MADIVYVNEADRESHRVKHRAQVAAWQTAREQASPKLLRPFGKAPSQHRPEDKGKA